MYLIYIKLYSVWDHNNEIKIIDNRELFNKQHTENHSIKIAWARKLKAYNIDRPNGGKSRSSYWLKKIYTESTQLEESIYSKVNDYFVFALKWEWMEYYSLTGN